MLKFLARLLRQWADLLDPPISASPAAQPQDPLYTTVQEAVAQANITYAHLSGSTRRRKVYATIKSANPTVSDHHIYLLIEQAVNTMREHD